MKSASKTAKELVGKDGRYSIKVKVIEKETMYTSLDKKMVEYQMFMLEDQQGSKLQTMLFNEELTVFEDIMEEDMTYEISNAKIRMMPGDYSKNPGEPMYQLHFTSDTFVLPILKAKPSANPEYILISSIPRTIELDDRYDVLGVVIYVDPNHNVPQLEGQPENSCEVVVVDQSSEQIMIITAWGDLPIEQCIALQSIAASFPVVSFTALRPSYRKGFSLATTHSTYISVDPQGEQATVLRNWQQANKDQLAAKNKHVSQVRQAKNIRNIVTVEWLLQREVRNTLQEEQQWLHIYLPEFRPEDVYLYLGCSNCGTGNSEDRGVTYSCTDCFKESVVSSPRMSFAFVAADGTGTYNFSAFTENAEKILEITAGTLHSMPPQEKENYLIQVGKRLRSNSIYIQVVPATSLSRAQVLRWVLKQVSLA